jgi:hypothetical protein
MTRRAGTAECPGAVSLPSDLQWADLEKLQQWLERQTTNASWSPSLGQAIAYLVGHGETLTRFLTVAGAPRQ